LTARLRRRQQERDWPTLPVPFFAFREIYEQLARRDWDAEGALPPFEFTNVPLILSALGHPYATAFGKPAYPSVPAKAAALFRGLVKNHGLRDGNKRLAVTTMSTFLLTNGWLPRYTNGQLYRYALRVARHQGPYPVPAIERWVRRNCDLAEEGRLNQIRRTNGRLNKATDLVRAAVQPVLWDPTLEPSRRRTGRRRTPK
jgi:death on curing protein